MNILRVLLFPFSVLYGLITYFRNKFYDFGWFKSTSFDIPIISVGNLSMGGTGKTPHIEYLIRLLKKDYKIVTLSRGYGRKTKGFFMADSFSNAQDIGDEPMQFYHKFPEIKVAVDADRVEGVEKILKSEVDSDLVLLDDAFQHRSIKPGFQILLTPYDDLYADDWVFPSGRLREFTMGKSRADIIVVTKCPENVTETEVSKINKKLHVSSNQQLFFSKIIYDSIVYGEGKVLDFNDLKDYKVLLVTGIANPDPLIKHLKSYDITFKNIKFADHHDFTEDDILNINSSFVNLGSGKKIVLTTEKDYVRLSTTSIHKDSLMYLPISVDFLHGDKDKFDKKIIDYVEQNKRNG